MVIYTVIIYVSIQGIFRAPKLNPSKFGTFRLPELRRSGEAERFFATENMGAAFLQMTKGIGGIRAGLLVNHLRVIISLSYLLDDV